VSEYCEHGKKFGGSMKKGHLSSKDIIDICSERLLRGLG
jgi:hypothetical protein